MHEICRQIPTFQKSEVLQFAKITPIQNGKNAFERNFED